MKFRSIVALGTAVPAVIFADVTGVVSTSTGKPVSGAFVRFVNAADSTKETSAWTDSLGRYSLKLPSVVGTAPRPSPGHGFSLCRNYPNPVSSHTVIPFSVDRPGLVTMAIFSAQGRLVKNLYHGRAAGSSTVVWDRTGASGARVSDGTYICRLEFDGRVLQNKLVVSECSPGAGPRTVSQAANVSRGKTVVASTYNLYVYGKSMYPVKARSVTVTDGMVKNFTQPYIDLWDSCRTILRDNLANSRRTFETTRQGRVAFVGGSITYNPGWCNYIIDSIKKRFPQTTFDFINAGIPSVGVNMHAFRLQKDIFYKGKVDLLFLESAVNDTGNGTISSIRTRGTEGIVRQALRNNPNVDIVFMYFAYDIFYADVQAGKPIRCLVDYEKSGRYYGVSSINDAQFVAENYTWAQFGGNVHPGAFGTALYTNAIQRMLTTAWKDTSQTGTIPQYLPPKPFDTFSYSYGHFDTLANAQLTNGWTYIPSWTPTDGVATRPGFVNVPVLQATTAGASLKFPFTGTAVGIVITSGPDAGKLDYFIDGKQLGTVDQYTPWSAGLHIPWTLIFADTLSNTAHQLVLRIATTKNSSSTGYACRIHQFAVNGK